MRIKSKFGFAVGDAVDVRTPGMKEWRSGRVVGFGTLKQNPSGIRVILDGGKTPYTIHVSFINRPVAR